MDEKQLIRVRVIFHGSLNSEYIAKEGLQRTWMQLDRTLPSFSELSKKVVADFKLKRLRAKHVGFQLDGFNLPRKSPVNILREGDVLTIIDREAMLAAAGEQSVVDAESPKPLTQTPGKTPAQKREREDAVDLPKADSDVPQREAKRLKSKKTKKKEEAPEAGVVLEAIKKASRSARRKKLKRERLKVKKAQQLEKHELSLLPAEPTRGVVGNRVKNALALAQLEREGEEGKGLADQKVVFKSREDTSDDEEVVDEKEEEDKMQKKDQVMEKLKEKAKEKQRAKEQKQKKAREEEKEENQKGKVEQVKGKINESRKKDKTGDVVMADETELKSQKSEQGSARVVFAECQIGTAAGESSVIREGVIKYQNQAEKKEEDSSDFAWKEKWKVVDAEKYPQLKEGTFPNVGDVLSYKVLELKPPTETFSAMGMPEMSDARGGKVEEAHPHTGQLVLSIWPPAAKDALVRARNELNRREKILQAQAEVEEGEMENDCNHVNYNEVQGWYEEEEVVEEEQIELPCFPYNEDDGSLNTDLMSMMDVRVIKSSQPCEPQVHATMSTPVTAARPSLPVPTTNSPRQLRTPPTLHSLRKNNQVTATKTVAESLRSTEQKGSVGGLLLTSASDPSTSIDGLNLDHWKDVADAIQEKKKLLQAADQREIAVKDGASVDTSVSPSNGGTTKVQLEANVERKGKPHPVNSRVVVSRRTQRSMGIGRLLEQLRREGEVEVESASK